MTGFTSKRKMAQDRLDDDDIQVYAQPELKGESMTKDEALKIARDALKNLPGFWADVDAAIDACNEALPQPEQLVAHCQGFWCVDLTCKKCYSADFRFKHKSSVDKKSLTTPAQRPWVGLTEASMKVLIEQARVVPTQVPCPDYNERLLTLANAVLKELNT